MVAVGWGQVRVRNVMQALGSDRAYTRLRPGLHQGPKPFRCGRGTQPASGRAPNLKVGGAHGSTLTHEGKATSGGLPVALAEGRLSCQHWGPGWALGREGCFGSFRPPVPRASDEALGPPLPYSPRRPLAPPLLSSPPLSAGPST